MKTWPSRKLGELVDILSGFAFDSSGFGESGELPLVRIRDVVEGHTSTFYTGPYDSRYIVRNGDVLIGMDGEFNRAKWRGGDALLNQRVCRIALSCPEMHDGYLYHYLPIALKAIEKSTPYVTVKHLSVKSVRDIQIPFPPLSEQRRIAEVLDRAEALRAKRRAALAQLDALTQAIFLEMFGDPTTNPKGWRAATVGDLLTFLQYGPRFYNEAYTEDGPRIVRITDLDSHGRLDFSAMPRLAVSPEDLEKYALRPGDIIFARTGATVGKVALISPSDPLCIAGAYFITMRFGQGIDPGYVRAVLTSPSVQAVVWMRSQQSAQQNFSGPGLRSLPMPVPPFPLQQEFARRVAAVEHLKSAHRESLAKLDELFASLQHRAFRGEV